MTALPAAAFVLSETTIQSLLWELDISSLLLFCPSLNCKERRAELPALLPNPTRNPSKKFRSPMIGV
jgi:hypothetical protein